MSSPLRAATRLWSEQVAQGFQYLDYLHARGSPLQALFYSGLFWPRFVEFDDMVFLEGTIEDESDRQRVREALARHGGDRAKTEQSFNTTEIPSLFGGRATETSDEEDQALAAALCAMWQCRLRELFPGRVFTVEVIPADDTGEVALRFHQSP